MNLLTIFNLSHAHLEGGTYGAIITLLICVLIGSFYIRKLKAKIPAKKSCDVDYKVDLSDLNKKNRLETWLLNSDTKVLFESKKTKVFQDELDNLVIWTDSNGNEDFQEFFLIETYEDDLFRVENKMTRDAFLLSIKVNGDVCNVDFHMDMVFKKKLQDNVFLVVEKGKEYLFMNIDNLNRETYEIPENMDLENPFVIFLGSRSFGCRAKNGNIIIRDYEFINFAPNREVIKELSKEIISEEFLRENNFSSVRIEDGDIPLLFFTKIVGDRTDLLIVKSEEEYWTFEYCDGMEYNKGMVSIFVNKVYTHQALVYLLPAAKLKGKRTIPFEFTHLLKPIEL
jgi:hypothetical protein